MGLSSIDHKDRKESGESEGVLSAIIHYKTVFIALVLLALIVLFIVGGGMIASLLSSKTITLPTTTTTTPTTSSTTSTSVSTTTLKPTATTSQTTTSTRPTTTSTTESTTTTFSAYQVAYCISTKIDTLYMRNGTVCMQCAGIRNRFGDVLESRITECDGDSKRDCDADLNDFKDNNALKTPGGATSKVIGYPTAVINGIAYVGVNARILEDLTGCG